jgi:hypothetical protein
MLRTVIELARAEPLAVAKPGRPVVEDNLGSRSHFTPVGGIQSADPK